MIVSSEVVRQTVDGDERVSLRKEIVRVDGPVPLVAVRKRPIDCPPGPPVLLVHGFGQNRYAWHLGGRSLVNFLAHQGFDVWNLDLRGQGRSRRAGSRPPSGIDPFVKEDLPAAIETIREQTGAPKVFLVGHSLGGLLCYAAAPERPDAVRGIVTIGAPLDFGRDNALLLAVAGLVEVLARLRVRPPARSFPAGGIGRHLARRRAVWEQTAWRLGLAFWATGSFEPEILREYGARAFDRANVPVLVRMLRMGATRRFTSDDGEVDYAARFFEIDVPLLVVAGTRDRLATPRAVRPAFDGSRAQSRSYREFPDGHADLVTGRFAPSRSWRAILGFLRSH